MHERLAIIGEGPWVSAAMAGRVLRSGPISDLIVVDKRKEEVKIPMKMAMMAGMLSALGSGMGGSPLDNTIHRNGVRPRKRNPWHGVDLTKAERRGKTYEQIQELRARRWLELSTTECDNCGGDGFIAGHDHSPGAHDENGSCNGSCPVPEPCWKCQGNGRVRKNGR